MEIKYKYWNEELDEFEELTVEYNYHPGDPGIHTYRNGDPGYPPTPEEYEIYAICNKSGEDVTELLSDADLADIEKEVMKDFDSKGWQPY